MIGKSVRASQYWAADKALSIFIMLLCMFLFVATPMTEILGARLFAMFSSLPLIAGAIATSRGGTLRVLVIASAASAVVYWAGLLVPGPRILTLNDALTALTLGLFIVVLLGEVFREGPMTLPRVFGAVSVYLLFGLMWAVAYHLVQLRIPGAINFVDMPPNFEALRGRLIHFSFVTLTTVGYGDITPIHPLARTLVMCEALTGQLFPAILIGGLASMAVQTRLKGPAVSGTQASLTDESPGHGSGPRD